MQANQESDWISAKDMMQMFSLSRSKTYEILAQEKEIETVQLGRSLRINKTSLERWVRSQRYPKGRESRTADRDG